MQKKVIMRSDQSWKGLVALDAMTATDVSTTFDI